jgi:hypothetical protein
MQQQALMTFDPATGETQALPEPRRAVARVARLRHGLAVQPVDWRPAQRWRRWHRCAGRLIQPPTEPLYAAQSDSNMCGQQQTSDGMTIRGGAIHGLRELMAEQRQSRITPAPHG